MSFYIYHPYHCRNDQRYSTSTASPHPLAASTSTSYINPSSRDFVLHRLYQPVLSPLRSTSTVSSHITMGRMNLETRTRVVVLSKAGFTLAEIQRRLYDEGIKISKPSLCLLVKKYNDHGTVKDLRWYCPPKSVSNVHL